MKVKMKKSNIMNETIKLKPVFKPSALKVAMGYRGISQTKLCKNIEGLSQPNLSKFLNGYYGVISEEKLKDIMKFLNFPFEFLYNEFNEIKMSHYL
jgi:transcriptional regulator with XRE-family HTH domain